MIKLGFVLLSNSADPIPSTRIAVLNMLPFLRAARFDPHIVFEPEQGCEQPDVTGLAARLIGQGFALVCFQKVHGARVEQMARELAAAGVKTVYCVCDLIDPNMTAATDATLVVTDFLRQHYPAELRSKVHVVHDGIEDPAMCKASWSDHRGSPGRPLRAVLLTSSSLVGLPHIGAPPAWLEVTIIGRYAPPRQLAGRVRGALQTLAQQPNSGDRLACVRFMLNRRIRCVPWSLERVRELVPRADIGIIPIDDRPLASALAPPFWMRKSECRLTLKMAAGLPVVTTPIPSYEPVIEHGVNGYFARSRADWCAAFEALRDPDMRQDMGQRARLAVLERYSMAQQARKLIDVFDELLGRAPATPS
jgi:hypothetical protein